MVPVGPSRFLPGATPYRYHADPRLRPDWRRARKLALARDRFACRICGRPATDVDHVEELIDGGSPFSLDNLQSLCGPCHDAKTSLAHYRRAQRAASAWGRMAVCPFCQGVGECGSCAPVRHPCGGCLGLRIVPEACAERRELPPQAQLAKVSSLAWAGAEPTEEGS